MVKFKASIESSDLLVIIEPCDTVENMLEFSLGIIGSIRSGIKTHINAYPQFLTSLEPLQVPIEYGDDLMLTDAANLIDEKALIQSMYIESAKAGVGPMATVAGITSEYLGQALLKKYGKVDLMIENGGDLFVHSKVQRHIGIYSGENSLSGKLNLRIKPEMTPLGICTSAGTLGHSLSFGQADAVVVLSKCTALADAVATATGNKIKNKDSIEPALEQAFDISGVLGVLVVADGSVGAIGEIELD